MESLSDLLSCLGTAKNENSFENFKNGKIPRYALKKDIQDYLGIFHNMGGRGLTNSQNFCKLTKYFFACQIHSEVLKHVLQRGGGDI